MQRARLLAKNQQSSGATTLSAAKHDPVAQDSIRSGALPGLFPIGPGQLE